MKYLILFFILPQMLMSTDFINKKSNYKEIDKKFTYEKTNIPTAKTCGCGEPAKLLPYNGEDIPLAKTEPCLSEGCQKTFIYEENI